MKKFKLFIVNMSLRLSAFALTKSHWAESQSDVNEVIAMRNKMLIEKDKMK